MKMDLKSTNKSCQQGFTLIEAAVVIMIVSLVMIPVFGFMQYKQRVDNQKDMSVNYERITTALEIFLKQNGRYPCPADATMSIGTNNFGDEVCGGTGVNSANNIYRGAVPTAALNLPYRLAENHDGWKLQYVVDQDQTTEANYNGAGNINIVDRGGNPVSSGVIYVLVDPGIDGKGATSMFGGAGPACGATANDSENCDNDRTFVDSEKTDIFNTASANYYDDTIYFQRPREDTGFWMTQRNPGSLSGLNIVNRNPGNIGIGTDTPSEKVDVSGNVRVDDDGSGTPTGGSVDVEMTIEAADINADNEVIIDQRILSPRFTYGASP